MSELNSFQEDINGSDNTYMSNSKNIINNKPGLYKT